MHLRKVTKEGRVNIPVELLEMFRIKENDFVEVTANRSSIVIRKHKESRVCSITGKVSRNLYKIGEAYISKEGLELIQKKTNELQN
ncbi:AbrB/MazE/SpoVT family DNA-binding domain-containing protein [Bacillus safensis]|uniref:AbrB/MazE/SpoVT family DNA-binding domain-containing protein n=1 Tax=Bacillus safensis TaxID=561879 RepID=UPI002E1ABDD4|nr:AbrB/MazE/SpoVT family DNA-binding domain-containing protein [Bacillus safensis]